MTTLANRFEAYEDYEDYDDDFRGGYSYRTNSKRDWKSKPGKDRRAVRYAREYKERGGVFRLSNYR